MRTIPDLQTMLIGCVFVASALAIPASAAPDMDSVSLTLTGCVVAGEAKNSYVLTNVTIDGAATAPRRAFYRFNTTKGLKDHVGRRVEVKGKADLDDMDKGKLRVRVDDDGQATTEITSERRTVKVDQNVWFGSLGSLKLDVDVATYKFEVEEVRRMAGNCQSAEAAIGRP
jgi:hypothetical protein